METLEPLYKNKGALEIIARKAKLDAEENPWRAYEAAKKRIAQLTAGNPDDYRHALRYLMQQMRL